MQGLRLTDWMDRKRELSEGPPVMLPSEAGDGCWKEADHHTSSLKPPPPMLGTMSLLHACDWIFSLLSPSPDHLMAPACSHTCQRL